MMCLTKLMEYYNLNCIYRILNIIIIIQYLLNKGQDLHQGGILPSSICLDPYWFNSAIAYNVALARMISVYHLRMIFFCIYFILNNKAYLISIKSIGEVY